MSPEAGMVHHGGNCCTALSVVHEEHAMTIEVDQLVLGVGKEAGYNHQKRMVALYPTKETRMKPHIRDNKGDIESHTADRKKTHKALLLYQKLKRNAQKSRCGSWHIIMKSNKFTKESKKRIQIRTQQASK